MSHSYNKMLRGVPFLKLQGDQLNMAVFFLVPCIKGLFQYTLLYTCILNKSLFQGIRKTRSCLIGHPVYIKKTAADSDYYDF